MTDVTYVSIYYRGDLMWQFTVPFAADAPEAKAAIEKALESQMEDWASPRRDFNVIAVPLQRHLEGLAGRGRLYL